VNRQTLQASGQISDKETAWTTVVGTIRKGMRVIDADGTCIGKVAALEGEEIILEGEGGRADVEFVALTQVDGVDETSVLLSGRGDATFGLGGEP
jgi:hypothetical protein